MRIHEIAKASGVSSKEVLAYLENLGQYAKSASSKIEEEIFVKVMIERLSTVK